MKLDIETESSGWIRYSYTLENVYEMRVMGENLIIRYSGSDPKNKFLKVVPIVEIVKLSYVREI